MILPNRVAGQAWRYITEKAGGNCIAPAGAAARDVLRIEAALPRYGHELNETIDPYTAGLDHAVALNHDFIGSQALARLSQSGPARRRVGLVFSSGEKPEETAIPPLGQPVFSPEGREIGAITSGTYSPTFRRIIAMAYVDAACSQTGQAVSVKTDSKEMTAQVGDLPPRRNDEPPD